MARPVYKYSMKLTGKEKHALRQAKRKGNTNACLVIRMLIILLADAGKTIAATGELLGCCEQTVLNRRKRFLARRCEGALAALMDLPRSGRPTTFGYDPSSLPLGCSGFLDCRWRLCSSSQYLPGTLEPYVCQCRGRLITGACQLVEPDRAILFHCPT